MELLSDGKTLSFARMWSETGPVGQKTSFNVNERLSGVKFPILFHMCASLIELPSILSTTLYSYLEEIEKHGDAVVGLADELLDEAAEAQMQVHFQFPKYTTSIRLCVSFILHD